MNKKNEKNEKRPLERRAVVCEVRADRDDERGAVITGRPIVYDKVTDMGGAFAEVIVKGALDHTDLRDVRLLVNHNTDGIPLARSRRNNGNSTMTLAVDDQGMEIRAVLDVEGNAEARALYSAVERGDVSGMSFMFSIAAEEWENLDSDYPKRYITEIGTVVEVSAVTWPAYEDTEIYAREAEALERAKQAVETARAAHVDTLVETGADIDAIEKLRLKIQIM